MKITQITIIFLLACLTVVVGDIKQAIANPNLIVETKLEEAQPIPFSLPVIFSLTGLIPHRLHGAQNCLGLESPCNFPFCLLPSAFCLLQCCSETKKWRSPNWCSSRC
ncbi:MAG: hypothetical protein WBA93_10080 [Microcoleaceae cyanobacterium]